MERDIDLREISDGKLYTAEDLVKSGCNDCEGCSECCRETGKSIILDPWDIFHLTCNLHTAFDALLEAGRVELNMADGAVLPNLRLQEGTGCTFLTPEGRCGIHAFRPGLCRLFPLGRVYEEGSFRYFLQIHECSRGKRTKVKIRKWLGIPELKRYEAYVLDWHDLMAAVRNEMKHTGDDGRRKELAMGVLQIFYLPKWNPEEDFYGQYQQRKETFMQRFSPAV